MHKVFRRSSALAAILALHSLTPAHAAQFKSVDVNASRIEFSYHQMNVKMQGGIRGLDVTEFLFDPDTPADSRIAIKVPVAGVDAGYDEANSELVKPEWLDVSKHPLAQFVSDSVEPVGGDKYKVNGQLTIKGKSHPVQALFTFTGKSGSGVFEGAFTFKRGDFGLGDGMWRDFSIVANDIAVTFHILALP